jgi:hypothetical protein
LQAARTRRDSRLVFDLLVSASVVVRDVADAVEQVTSRLGVPQPRPSWLAPAPGLEAMFCRTHPSMAVSPTRLELIAPVPITDPGVPLRFYVPEIVAVQGDRPIKSHATALATSRQSDVIDRLERLAVRHRIDPAGPGYWPLVWLGVSPDEPAAYDASVDAGLMVEVVDTESLHLRPEVYKGDVGVPEGLAEGSMVRVAAKGVLVRDLDEALRALDRHLDWQPEDSVRTVRSEGYRCARMGFELPQSARVELIEPIADGAPAEFLTRWGPGPYQTRISVNGLGAKAEDLRRRGTPFNAVRRSGNSPGTLRVFEPDVVGALFEFVDHEEYFG